MGNEKNVNQNTEIAGRNFQIDDYTSNSELASGLATTHEQVSDAYMEGTIEGRIDNVKGKDIDIPTKGFDE